MVDISEAKILRKRAYQEQSFQEFHILSGQFPYLDITFHDHCKYMEVERICSPTFDMSDTKVEIQSELSRENSFNKLFRDYVYQSSL